MKVFIERENKEVELVASNGAEILSQLKINPDTVLLVKNDEIILADEELSETDTIKILSVVSGG